MVLTKYNQKRNFEESPEPIAGSPDKDKLRFVIQKYAASRLYYDLRLEMKGVLKSLAVPKCPSTNFDAKRLAVMVKVNPYDYRNFEGIVPSSYAAGAVIVWDEGFNEIADANVKDGETQDKELRKGIHSGKLHIVLKGRKLRNEFALIKTLDRGENAWLLFPVKYKYVSKDNFTLLDQSVISKKTLKQIEKTTTNFYGLHRVKESSVNSKNETSLNERPTVKVTSAKYKKEKEQEIATDPIVTKGTSAKFPNSLSPMLATIVDKPFEKEGWQYEIKWDSYLALAFCEKDEVELKSRNYKSFGAKFYLVHKALQQWNISAVVDGEVVVLNEDGKPNFGALQNWRSEAEGALYFYVFDLLSINGKDLTQLPLSERRDLLKQMIPEIDLILLSENFEVNGIEFFETAKKMGLEGIIAKKADSVYSAGNRSKNWLKIKANKRHEMVIGGYTKNNKASKSFSFLLLGVYEEGKLVYTNKTRTGFTDKQQLEMLEQFKHYVITTPSFTELPDFDKPSRFQRNPLKATAVCLKPELVCEVSYTQMTADGLMRHPSIEAMRIDKNATVVIKKVGIQTDDAIMEEKAAVRKTVKSAVSKEQNTFLNTNDTIQLREINGHEIKFTNFNKRYWPDKKITKRNVLHYYYQVAPYILKYLNGRPQSIKPHPKGGTGESFYFEDGTVKAPDWIETFKCKSDADDRKKRYLVAKDEASLLYMANLGCIEIIP